MKLRLFAITAVIVLVFLLSGVTAVFAANPPGTGQPSQTCGSSTAMSSPGKASSAKGSAFNPNGVAPSVYAGTQPQNSKNPKSVAQYDVACFQVSQTH